MILSVLKGCLLCAQKVNRGDLMINDSINRFLGVLCYPFASLEAFREDLINQYILSVRAKDRSDAADTRKRLKSEMIGYIRQNYNIYSYDEIYLYLEKCYLHYGVECYDNALQLYQHVMMRMASTLISHRDGRIVFKYWKNKNDEELFGGFANSNKVALFHSINCHIPMDVIAIVYMIINQPNMDAGCLDYFYGNIEVADQQLSRILEKGVAENHLHKGVSRTFSSIWDSLMEPLTVKNSKFFWEREFVDGTEEQNRQMVFYILSCGIVRVYLALRISSALMKRRLSVQDSYGEEIEKLIKYFQDGQMLDKFFREYFQDKNVKEITAHYVDLWNSLEENRQMAFSAEKICASILNVDPGLHTTDENIFLYYALSEMINGDIEEDVKQCIMQYLRIRNYLFRVSVQQKTIKGLDYFQQAHYNVNSALNHVNIKNFWEAAIREQLQNQDLHKVEFRSSMPVNYRKCKLEILDFLKAYQKIIWEDYSYYDDEKKERVFYRRIPQVGLVVHFLKRPDESVPEKCCQNGKDDCSYFHYGKLQREYEKQIENLVQLRTEYKELSRYLVGIDAASLENSTPVWVFAPIYEKARDSRTEQIGRRNEYGDYTQSLGFTFHAGEDFRHILSGLRRIDEAVEHLKFHAGDRIGHGIALGISAREWKNQNPVIIIPQIEALENYLWAYDTLSKNYSDFQATILAYIEKQIYELSGRIYGYREGGVERGEEGVAIEILISGYHRLFALQKRDDKAAKRDYTNIEKNFCQMLCSGKRICWDPLLLTAARHCKKFVKEMEKPVHYEIMEQDILIVEELQKILRKKLGRKGIVLEVNPSSNTAIADLDVVQNNQLYQMNHIYDEQNVIVCINSDDPAVFNTNVSNELAYIYYGMLEHNVSREAALLWVDRIRNNGLDSSFIRHRESDKLLMKKLDELIDSM